MVILCHECLWLKWGKYCWSQHMGNKESGLHTLIFKNTFCIGNKSIGMKQKLWIVLYV